MDKLKSLGQKIKKIKLSEIISKAIAVAIGIIMGLGSFLVFKTTFGLKYSVSDAFSGGTSGGLIHIWNSIMAKLAEECGIFYDQLEGASDSAGLCMTLILLFLVVLSVLIVFSRNKWFAIIYPVFSLLPLIWGLHGSTLAFAILAVGVLLFLISVQGESKDYSGFIYVIAICLAGFIILSIPAVSKLADKPQALKDYNDKVHESMVDKHYGTNPLDEGYLLDKKRSKGGKSVALKIDMSNPQPMYLRGFVGDILEDDGWKPLSNSVYYQNRDLTYWLNQSGFSGLGQLQQSSEIAYSGGKKKLNTAYFPQINDIKVNNVGANKKYAYVPYGMCDGEIKGLGGDELKYQNWGDSFITGKGRATIDGYSCSAVSGVTDKWTEIAAKYYSNRVNIDAYNTYQVTESHYNDYVYKNYRYLSDDQIKILDKMMPAKGDQKRGHVEYNVAVQSTKTLIQNSLYYTEKLHAWKKNKSALENIISSGNGYDAHYATLATVIFRYYGIPARYVEGYIVTTQNAMNSMYGGEKIKVTKADYHAWCEIYVDGVGFVPVEVCPNYQGLLPEADYTIGITNKTKKPEPDHSSDVSENPNDTEKLSSDVNEKNIPKKIVLIIGIIVGIILLGLIVLGLIFAIKRIRRFFKRKKLFKKGEPRAAIRGIYEYMEKKGIKADAQAVEIGNRASYSINMVTSDERDIMLKKLKGDKKSKKGKKDKKDKKDKGKKESKKGKIGRKNEDYK